MAGQKDIWTTKKRALNLEKADEINKNNKQLRGQQI